MAIKLDEFELMKCFSSKLKKTWFWTPVYALQSSLEKKCSFFETKILASRKAGDERKVYIECEEGILK